MTQNDPTLDPLQQVVKNAEDAEVSLNEAIATRDQLVASLKANSDDIVTKHDAFLAARAAVAALPAKFPDPLDPPPAPPAPDPAPAPAPEPPTDPTPAT